MMEENICLPHRLTHIYLSVDRLKAICQEWVSES